MSDTTDMMSPPFSSLEGHVEPYQAWMIVILSVVIVIGIPGNLLVFSVYFSKSKKSSTNMLILSMAILDECITLFSVARMLHWIHETSYETSYKCQGYQVLGSWSEFFSAFMTTTIAVDRYFQICRPHFPMTATKALLCSIVGLGISNIFSIPVSFLYGVEDYRCQIIKDGLALYIPLGLAFACFIVLMVTALVLYVLVYLEVRKRFQSRTGSVLSIRPIDSAFVDSNKGHTTTVTHVSAVMDVSCKRDEKGTWGNDIGGHGQASAGDGQDNNDGRIKSESCSIRASATYVGVKIERGCDGSEKVEVERSEMAVKKTTTIDRTPTTNERNQSTPMTTGLGNIDKQYEDLMKAIIETNVPSKEMITLPGSSANPARLRPDSRTGSRVSRSSGRTGRMLLLATVVFVGTWTARCIMWFITNIESDWWESLRFRNVHAYAFLTALQHIYYTTPAVNPIIYSFANPRFRSDSVRMLKAVRLWHNKVFPR